MPEVNRSPVDLRVRLARLGDNDPASLDHLLTPAERQRTMRPSRSSLAGTSPRRAARGLAFALGRAMSRATVAQLSGLDPLEIGFEADERGKPRIVRGPRRSPDGHGPSAWQHSVAHSGDLVVVAVARGAAVGVDVEVTEGSRPTGRLAKRFFHPDEAALLASLPPDVATAAFYELWTRKESVLKALGSGLSGRLDSVAPVLERPVDPVVGPRPDPPSRRGCEGSGGSGAVEAPRWRVERGGDRFEGADIVVPPGYRGAVAVRGELGLVDVRGWSGPGGSFR